MHAKSEARYMGTISYLHIYREYSVLVLVYLIASLRQTPVTQGDSSPATGSAIYGPRIRRVKLLLTAT